MKKFNLDEVFSDPVKIAAAFEKYYSLGSGRTVNAVAKSTKIPFATISDWKSLHAWDEQVKERDADIYSATERLYVDKSRNIRNRLIGQVGRLLDDIDTCSLGLPFRVTTVDDLRKLAQAYKMLVEANAVSLNKGNDILDSDSPQSWAELIKKFSNQDISEHTEADFKDV